MQVNALDHINIVTTDVPRAATFYGDLLGLTSDPRISMNTEKAAWLCDVEGRPIVHLNSLSLTRPMDRPFEPGAETGPIHHVAFNCTGYDEMIARLEARGAAFECNEVAKVGLRQIFTRDPDNVLLELNFFAD